MFACDNINHYNFMTTSLIIKLICIQEKKNIYAGNKNSNYTVKLPSIVEELSFCFVEFFSNCIVISQKLNCQHLKWIRKQMGMILVESIDVFHNAGVAPKFALK
ncbi:hypothetical protein BLOT_006971 [Blomia tropicalis]|nr:hypothetical protein BLOT_006971 [Blomia tropicalis]